MKFSPPFFCFDWLCIKKGAEIHIICKTEYNEERVCLSSKFK